MWDNALVRNCSFQNIGDGCIGIHHGATDITLCWNFFTQTYWPSQRAVKIGDGYCNGPNCCDCGCASENKNIRVTMHHNYFYRTHERNPKIEQSNVHFYNNVIDQPKGYAVAVLDKGQLLLEGNIFQGMRARKKDHTYSNYLYCHYCFTWSMYKCPEGTVGHDRATGKRCDSGFVKLNNNWFDDSTRWYNSDRDLCHSEAVTFQNDLPYDYELELNKSKLIAAIRRNSGSWNRKK